MTDREFSCGHRHGNFRNYYNFHSCDERLNQLPITELQKRSQLEGRHEIFILDIGCNEGDLSVGVLNKAREAFPSISCSLLGVDIDPVLIERATSKFTATEDRSAVETAKGNPRVLFKCFDILSVEFDEYLKDYCAERGITAFDVVCCFSITMWVHLNSGDDGLERFLRKSVLLSDNFLIIEPQAWKSYKNAVERCRRQGLAVFPHYSSLTWRNSICEDIATFVSSIEGVVLLNKSRMAPFEGEEKDKDVKIWGRDFLVFEKVKPPR
jgi:SAM-dependent methyltransferase